MDQLVSLGCPLPQYIKDGGGGGRPRLVRPGCGVLLGLLVGVHQEGRKGEGSGGEGEVAGPLFPSPIRTPHGRGRATSWAAALSLPSGPLRPNTSPGGSGNPPALRFSPKSPRTLPVSEYSRPIYRSLCLDHFETPRHVRDHIRDSEQPSVHQNI